MATDTRGHTVPASSDHPTRQTLLTAMLSVKDPIPVANSTARAALITALAALSPAILPSTSNPIEVFRADATVGNEHEYTTDGITWYAMPGSLSAGVWQTYTPTLTGITIGNGSVDAYYLRIGQTIIVRVEITLGSTSAVTGEVSFTLPVTAKYGKRTGTATGRLTNAGSPYGLACWSASSTTVQLIRYMASSNLLTAITSTTPGTWASTGWIEAELTYEAA